MSLSAVPGLTMAGVVVFVAVAGWFAPRWTPEGFAFGVPVTAEWRASPEAQRILRGYRMRVLLVAAVALVVAVLIAVLGWIEVTAAPPLIALAGMFWGYASAHRRAWPHAVHAAGPQIASAKAQPSAPVVASLRAQLVPFGLLALAGVALVLRWDEIPQRFPTHWNAQGVVDGWGSRTVGSVFWPLGFAALVCAGLYLLLHGTIAWSRRGAPGAGAERVFAQRRMASTVVFGAECLVALIHAGISLMPLVRDPHALITGTLTVTGLFAIALPIWMGLTSRRLPRGEAAAEARPPESLQHWKWGLFYANRNDPAVFVEKRFGFGYTINFGSPVAWLVLVMLLLPGLLIPLVVFLTGHH